MRQKEVNMHLARILVREGHTQKEIARRLGVTDRTVRNYLNRSQKARPRKQRVSKVESYYGIIDESLEENPYTNLVVLFERLQRCGYTGGMTILRDYARSVRKRIITRAVRRFETEPGRQAQVDWKECGRWTIDGREQKLYAFVMLLGFSRKPFVLFTSDMTLPTLLAAHLLAFDWFGAVPREILYDNMKTAWNYSDTTWIVNPGLLELASACGFTPKRCQVRRPQTKGKVERFIGYLAHNFLVREDVCSLGSIADLNKAVLQWLSDLDAKQVKGVRKTRIERFNEEKPHMNPWVPSAAPDVRMAKELLVSREGTIRFETNRYSLDASLIGQMVTLRVDTLTREAEVFHDGTL
jgi:transposase